MNTYISILRGINVSGHKMVKMDALKNIYQKLDFQNTQTYIQSGNVIFQSKIKDTGLLEKQIAKQINEAFGFEVPIIVMPLEQLKTVFTNNLFLSKRKEDISKLHVTFLSDLPEQGHIDLIAAGDYGSDEFVFSGKAVYLFCPNGYGNTKLNNNFFENKLKLTATTRNWKTMTELVKIAEEISGRN